jgi:ketosteroid isomerase-like protein
MTTDEAEREIRGLHQRWFAATAAKDLDRLMEPIADAVVSYEHERPLQYLGRDRVREVCANGLNASDGMVTWTVPDMRVVVRGDLAVAWGLNRMTAQQADGNVVETWSRGTRIFQKTDQGWELIHQHLSFPFDPETGQATTDLAPAR